MRLPLTPRQQLVFEYIADYIKRHGVGPTFQEINGYLGTGYSTAYHYVSVLEQKGYISKRFNSSRSIRILEEAPHPVKLAAFVASLGYQIIPAVSELITAYQLYVEGDRVPTSKAFSQWIKDNKYQQFEKGGGTK